MNPHPTFCFLDESGTFLGGVSRYYGLGVIIHPNPEFLIENLHQPFEDLIARCRRVRTDQEFHFADLTLGTLNPYLKALDCLERDRNWRFCSVIIDLQDPSFHPPKTPLDAWAYYVRWVRILLKQNLREDESAVLLTDYSRRPKGTTQSIATLPEKVSQIWSVLQVESHGVLLIQMADVLLGASLYGGVNEAKRKLAARVTVLAGSVGKARFNEWRVKWKE